MRNIHARLSFLNKLQSAADELIKVVGEVMESEEASSILQRLDDTTRELVLMAYLKYEETKVLEAAVNMIPNHMVRVA